MNRKGFTLIELMIVIAIIGILAAMAVPNFKKARASARQKACMSNLRVIEGAVEMYNMDHNNDLTATTFTKTGTSVTVPTTLSGYIKPMALPDGQCAYSWVIDATNGNYAKCTFHGNIAAPNAKAAQ